MWVGKMFHARFTVARKIEKELLLAESLQKFTVKRVALVWRFLARTPVHKAFYRSIHQTVVGWLEDYFVCVGNLVQTLRTRNTTASISFTRHVKLSSWWKYRLDVVVWNPTVVLKSIAVWFWSCYANKVFETKLTKKSVWRFPSSKSNLLKYSTNKSFSSAPRDKITEILLTEVWCNISFTQSA